MSRSKDPRCPSSTRETQIAITDATTDAAVGQVAPTITGTTFDDQEVTIGPDGTPKAVYFLAHHCQFCQAEVPVIQGLVDSGQQPDGMQIYAVSTSVIDRPNANYPPELWFNRETSRRQRSGTAGATRRSTRWVA